MVVIAYKRKVVKQVKASVPRSTVLAIDSPIRNASPLFVLGAPRSGTTLCADLLNSHPEVLITNEVRVFSFFSYSLAHIPDGDSGGIQYSRSHPDAFSASLREAIPSIVTQTFDRISREVGRADLKYWGDKNPHHADCLDLIIGAFPDARFVRMKRDPRDIACSIMEMNSWNVEQAGRAVRVNIERARVFQGTLPESAWHDVSYEALVREPDRVIKLLMSEFLGLEDLSVPLAWMQENRAFDRHHRFSDSTDFEKKSIARWERDLSGEQAAKLNEIIADVISMEGY